MNTYLAIKFFFCALLIIASGNVFAQTHPETADSLIRKPVSGDIKYLKLNGNITVTIAKGAENQLEIKAAKKIIEEVKYGLGEAGLSVNAPTKSAAKVYVTLTLVNPDINGMDCKGNVKVVYK